MSCKWEDWKIINARDDKDYVCTHPAQYTPGYTLRCCYGNETCKYYEPVPCKTCKHHDEEKKEGIIFSSCDQYRCDYEPREEVHG